MPAQIQAQGAADIQAPARMDAPSEARNATSGTIDGVVELFTSQGCAPCLPADAEITRLSDEGDLLVLSYHVDYWDYIGWRDPLGSPRNTERQRAYAKAMGERSVYTPQIILNGARKIASTGEDIADALGESPLDHSPRAAQLTLTRTGPTLSILAEAPDFDVSNGQIVVILLTFNEKTTTSVERGENGGKSLLNTHSVRDWQVVGKFDGTPLAVEMPVASLVGIDGEPMNGAVILQHMEDDGTPGAILAAATMPL